MLAPSSGWISIPGLGDGLTTYAVIWEPEGETRGAVILLQGGWMFNVLDPALQPVVQMLVREGYEVLGLDYRGRPGHGPHFDSLEDIGTKEVDDVISAAVWLREHRRVSFLALVGFSHGGALALRAAEEFPGCGLGLDAVLAYGPITDYEAWFEFCCAQNNKWHCDLLKRFTPEQRRQGSPLYFADQLKIPVFLAHGSRDRTVPLTQSQAWLAAHPDSSLFIFPGDHGDLFNPAALDLGLTWLNRVRNDGERKD